MEGLIAAIIGVISGSAAGAIISGLFAKKKVRSDVNRETSTAWKEFAEKMETRQNELDADLISARKENKATNEELKRTNKKLDRYGERIIYLTTGIEILVKQILDDGKQPCWAPNSWSPNKEGDE